ncbi:MAG: acyl-CoA dehydrogenase family protein [Marinifilaceae bacterium]|jgi:alkylation response protein AidB-like acyl-CoA dehydrogenase|nr:acyl-CoA dehydrogenase family protein [Marinifilaceae bacterium]
MINLSEEHKLVMYTSRQFAKSEILPEAIQRDKTQTFPKEIVKKLGQLGYMGMMVSTDYGGGGMDSLSYVLAISEIAKIDASVAVTMSINNSLVCGSIENSKSEFLKNKYLTSLCNGNKIGSFLLSEPQAGSDARAISCNAKDKGDYYEISGTKNWISNAKNSQVFILVAQTDVAKRDKGVVVLLVDSDSPGIELGKKEQKMGLKSSDTRSVSFNKLKVSKENLISPPGEGFSFVMKVLEAGRIGIAAQAYGIASGAFQIALDYAHHRKTFGKKLIDHQAIAFMLSEMRTEIEAVKLLCYQVACLKDSGKSYGMQSSMAKLFASQVAMKTTTNAVQILGGYGYVADYHVERMMRDAKITQIYEGSSEIQKLIIAKHLKQN